MRHNLTPSPHSDRLPCHEGCGSLVEGIDRSDCPCGDGWVCGLCDVLNCDGGCP